MSQIPVGQGDALAEHANIRSELRAFRQPQIWLCLGIVTIAGAALFCTFTYITPMMTHVAHYPPGAIIPLLMLFGLGMTIGNAVGARLADRALMRTVCLAILGEVVIAIAFYFGSHDKLVSAAMILLFPGFALATSPGLQARIVDLAGGAPNLAAASIQAAFNIANSMGAWLGGLVIAQGLGYSAPNLVAAALALSGLGIAAWSWRLATTAAGLGGAAKAATQAG
jgi:DHA1 family inner membrane transport protein